MKFYLKPKKVLPEVGDVRNVRKFALLPAKVGRTVVWLEYYVSNQEWVPARLVEFAAPGEYYWRAAQWEENSRELLPPKRAGYNRCGYFIGRVDSGEE